MKPQQNSGGGFDLLDPPLDLTLWRDADGRWQGVIQDGVGLVPPALMQLTTTWQQMETPTPIARR